MISAKFACCISFQFNYGNPSSFSICRLINRQLLNEEPSSTSMEADKDVSGNVENEVKIQKENEKQLEGNEKTDVGACCGCIGLKRATKIIAYVQIVLSSLVFIYTAFFDLASDGIFTWKFNYTSNEEDFSFNCTDANEKVQFCGAHGMELESLIMICTAIRLLVGTYKNKPNLVEAWFHTTTELICLSLFLSLSRALITYTLTNGKFHSLDIGTEIVFNGVMFYFIWTVYKYYRQVKGKHIKKNFCNTI